MFLRLRLIASPPVFYDGLSPIVKDMAMGAPDFDDIMNRLLPDIIVTGRVDRAECRRSFPCNMRILTAILRSAQPRSDIEEQVLGHMTTFMAERLARRGSFLLLDRPLNYVGWQMEVPQASICIVGGAGSFLGAYMKAGSILCTGDCGHFAFKGASGGRALVIGRAGDYCAEEMEGRADVRIVGSVGRSAARRMRGGQLTIRGDAGPFFCRYMEGGTVRVRDVEMMGETFGGTVYARAVKAFEKGNAGRHEAELIIERRQ
jgi:hypothetical protein